MKTAIVVLADIETHEALGRAVNAMVTALDFHGRRLQILTF